jgi:hypothetical protein
VEILLVGLCARWESVSDDTALTLGDRLPECVENSDDYISAKLTQLFAVESTAITPHRPAVFGILE